MFSKNLLILSLICVAGAANAALVYSNTVESGFRYNANAPANGTPNSITLDDVIISNPTSAPTFAITKITLGVRRLANAGEITVEAFGSALDWNTYVASNIQSLGITSLAKNGASSTTQQVVFGNGVNVLKYVALSDAGGGLASFAAGLRFSGANSDYSLNGWRIVANPVSGSYTGQTGLSDDLFVDSNGAVQTLYNFGGWSSTIPVGSFYMKIEGNAVPEPATFAVLGVGLLPLLRRRRK